MAPRSVTDALSNREEHIVELANLIGKGRKRDIFEAVYHGKKSTKTVADIAETLGLTEKQVLTAGKPLVDGHAFDQTKVDGRTAYQKITSHKAIKAKVLAIAGDPKKIARIPTKRKPVASSTNSLFKVAKKTKKRAKRSAASRKAPSEGRVDIAFLMASPVNETPLEVQVEARELETERSKSPRSDTFHFSLFPAANVDSLLKAVNEIGAPILHFSGHGSEGAVVLDRETIGADEYKVVSSKALGKILKTGKNRPKLIVLNACESAADVEHLTKVADHVVATSESIPDAMALEFARRFYSALFAGRDLKSAFDQAIAVVELDFSNVGEVVQLFSAEDCDASVISF